MGKEFARDAIPYVNPQPTVLSHMAANILNRLLLALLFVVVGALVGLAAVILSDGNWAWLRGSLAVGMLAAAASLLALAWNGTVRAMERITGLDLDADGQVDNRPIIVNGREETPASRRRRLVTAMIQGWATSTDERSRPEGIDVTDFRSWRDACVRARLARWKSPGNPQQGWELVCTPEEIIRRLLPE